MIQPKYVQIYKYNLNFNNIGPIQVQLSLKLKSWD